jgi:hypothetical protein
MISSWCFGSGLKLPLFYIWLRVVRPQIAAAGVVAVGIQHTRTVSTKRLVLENKLYDDRHLKYQIQKTGFIEYGSMNTALFVSGSIRIRFKQKRTVHA